MGIKHSATKASNEKGYATEWNADHTITSDVPFNGHSGTGVGEPINPSDIATKNYVDSKAGTLDYCRVWKNYTQGISGNTTAYIQWDSESYDGNSMHDNATNNTRIYIKEGGLYLINVSIDIDTTSNEIAIEEFIRKNGNDFYKIAYNMDVTTSCINVCYKSYKLTAIVMLNKNDYIEIGVHPLQGVTIWNGANMSWCEVVKLR